MDALNKELDVKDVLVVLYKMPSLKIDAMPMIGDLQELRMKKAQKIIDQCIKNLETANHKKIYIFENRISIAELKKELDFTKELIVLHTPNQSSFIKSLFSANGYAHQIHFEEIQTSL